MDEGQRPTSADQEAPAFVQDAFALAKTRFVDCIEDDIVFLVRFGIVLAGIVDDKKRNETYQQLTDHYFTGEYPVKLVDELGDNKITQLSLLSTGSNN